MPFPKRKIKLRSVLQLPVNSWTAVAILVCILTVILNQVVYSARIQTYTIFSDVDSKGERESFTDNIQDLFTVSKLIKEGKVKWKCIERGIWLEYSGVNYNFKNRNSLQYHHILYDGKCFPPAPNRSIQSIRHIGNSDLELPGISLYRHENFTGEELYFDGTMLQLPVSITFQSFGITGQESWTVYSGTDFTGESNVCLQPQRVVEVVHKKDILDSQLIFTNAHTHQTLYVGSIRRGCGHHNGGGSGGYGHQHSVMHPQMTNKHRPNVVPTLSLFSQMTSRENMLHMDGTEAKLPGTGHTFVAYSLVGNNNWTIFSGSEFNGVAKCLYVPVPENATASAAAVPAEQHFHSPYYGAGGLGLGGNVGTPIENATTIGEQVTFSVGSIRRGCDTDGKAGASRLVRAWAWGSGSASCLMAIIAMLTIT